MFESARDAVHRIIHREGADDTLSDQDVQELQLLNQADALKALREMRSAASESRVLVRTYHAIYSLRDIDHVEWLVEALQEPYSEAYFTYTYDLAGYNDERAIAKLTALLLNHPEQNLKGYVAELLVEYDHPIVIAALEYARDHFGHLDYMNIPVSDSARWALEQIERRRQTE